jgi:hypothetical protein
MHSLFPQESRRSSTLIIVQPTAGVGTAGTAGTGAAVVGAADTVLNGAGASAAAAATTTTINTARSVDGIFGGGNAGEENAVREYGGRHDDSSNGGDGAVPLPPLKTASLDTLMSVDLPPSGRLVTTVRTSAV